MFPAHAAQHLGIGSRFGFGFGFGFGSGTKFGFRFRFGLGLTRRRAAPAGKRLPDPTLPPTLPLSLPPAHQRAKVLPERAGDGRRGGDRQRPQAALVTWLAG